MDYTTSQLGGGAFPNAKVVGGMDVADEDSDPMDCDGHGTSVSGIIAGPNGVAPDAKIVALKACTVVGYCFVDSVAAALR